MWLQAYFLSQGSGSETIDKNWGDLHKKKKKKVNAFTDTKVIHFLA